MAQNSKKVLIVGAGAREHAIAQKLREQDLNQELTITLAPGNGGIEKDGFECVDIKTTEIEKIVELSRERTFDLVVVASDDPLALGLVDQLETNGIRAFGPRQKEAQMESSKVFAKKFMEKYSIPTAQHCSFDSYDVAINFLANSNEAPNFPYFPCVIKVDGLALGKGVTIVNNFEEAETTLKEIFIEQKFGVSGNQIVIEEFLEGTELSLLTFTDSNTYQLMPPASDYKNIFDGNLGPNTGGMGAYSPSKIWSEELKELIAKTIVEPTFLGLKKENLKYQGVLYFGLMASPDLKKVWVIEYNSRFGDPETQVLMPRLESSLWDIFNSCVDEKLSDLNIKWNEKATVGVVMSAENYPGTPKKGDLITLPESLFQNTPNIFLFFAGTKLEDGQLYTNGGRVLTLVAQANTREEARELVYQKIKNINFRGEHYRKDIGA